MIFERLEAHGKTWKVYVDEPMPLSFAGIIHYSRLKDKLATNFVPFTEFEKDAAAGTLPDFSLIEPNMLTGHGDYHPAVGRALGTVDVPIDTHHPSWAAKPSSPATSTSTARPPPSRVPTCGTRLS